MTKIIPIARPDDDPAREIFDFTSPEDVLIEVVRDDEISSLPSRTPFSIETCTIINQANPDVTGAASYEHSYGGFLDYTIQDMIDYPGEGWFVVEGVTGHYHKGDGWMTDDDMDFYYVLVRPATPEEISLA